MLLTQQFEPYIRTVCAEKNLPLLADKVIKHAKPALRMHTIAIPMYGDFTTRSRFGGKPALPESVPWPENEDGFQFDFILQINLSEIRLSPQAACLPDSGMLYVFADHRNQQSLDGGFCQRVVYSIEAELALRDIPFDYEYEDSKIPERLIRFSEIMTVYDAHRLQKYCDVDLNDKEVEIHKTYFDCATCDDALHLLLGVQTHDDHSGAISGLTGEYVSNDQDLQLLFRIDWDNDTNTQWMDGGRLYLYIHPNDLAKRDFSRVSSAYMSY
ncbi:MAG: YwqG family protein [Deinococcota bacterium]